LGVNLISISSDGYLEQAAGKVEYGITEIPMLVDENRSVSREFGVLKWAVGTGEPGHTFILVDSKGKIAWIQDYGAPENGGIMYVPVGELTQEVSDRLNE
jgi:peroxiredoxin